MINGASLGVPVKLLRGLINQSRDVTIKAPVRTALVDVQGQVPVLPRLPLWPVNVAHVLPSGFSFIVSRNLQKNKQN